MQLSLSATEVQQAHTNHRQAHQYLTKIDQRRMVADDIAQNGRKKPKDAAAAEQDEQASQKPVFAGILHLAAPLVA